MATTVEQIGGLIKSVTNNENLTDDDIVTAVNMAVSAITAYKPRRSVSTFSGDGSTTVFDLPSDFYWVDGVFDANGEKMNPVSVSDADYIGSGGVGYILYPHGKITFLTAPTGTATMYYLASWPNITAVTETIPTPEYLNIAIVHYASAWVLMPEAVSAAQIRQYNTKVDSGNPEDNPVFRQVLGLLNLFYMEVERHGVYSFRGEQ